MLMALLYSKQEQIIAAAPACDQVAMGDLYWIEIHAAEISPAEVFETAYVSVENSALRNKLLMLGIDESLSSNELTGLVESGPISQYENKAA